MKIYKGNLIVKFDDEFVNGTAILEIQRNDEKYYLVMQKENESYYLPILSSLLSETTTIIMQIRITEGTDNESIPVWKSNKFYLKVEEAINAEIPIPQEYAEWIDIANAKLNELDNIDIDVNKVGNTATVSITKKDGTEKRVEIYDGLKGDTGANGLDAKINGVNTLTIEAGTNITLDQEGNILTINSTASGGSSDYEGLNNLPKVNNVELKGNKSLNDLGIQPAGDYAFISDIPDVSNFITKDVNNLSYYTKTSDLATVASSGNYNDLTNQPNLSGFATTTELGNERTARENADIGLQEQIDAITSSSDVKDIVGTYIDLQNYDTSILGNDDIIKVLQDNTHNDAMSYYRWIISGNNGSWQYIGQEGPYYTKGETDVLFNGKQNVISNSNKLQSDLVDDTNQSNLFVTTSEKTTWNNKVDQSELTNYVEKSDYATTSKAGLVRTSNDYATQVSGTSGIFFTNKNI